MTFGNIDIGISTVDFAIIIGYLLFITSVGLWYSRKASKGSDDYFLGGRSIPWYLLGISGMANFVDMGGTARQCAGYLLYGAKGFWLCLDGAVALLLSFQMIYIAKWLRRSQVMTNAEWMIFRYGDIKQGKSARIVSAVSALVLCAALMTFFFVGTAKVLPVFVPGLVEWCGSYFSEILGAQVNGANVIAIAFMTLVAFYTITAGFYGVIYTDFVQAFMIFALIGFVSWKAFTVGTPEYIAQYAPEGWNRLWPSGGEWFSLDFLGKFDGEATKSYANKLPIFGTLIIFWMLNNTLQGAATPFDSWTAQRYYAAKNEREAALSVGQWIVLWSFRFLLMAGIGVLALKFVGTDGMGDPEHALSVVIREVMPVGITGLLLAALFAAQMSTVDSTANSSAAYFVNDVYKPFFKPHATDKQMMRMSYIITFVLIIIGMIIGLTVTNVDSIWSWIMSGLFVGALPPNIAKWFWWRANGWSFTWGTVCGLLAAILTQAVPALNGLPAYWSFTFVFGMASIGTIASALLTEPTEIATVVKFYEQTKPFGFWGPVKKVANVKIVAEACKENRQDLLNLPIACTWHISLFLLMSSLIFRDWVVIVTCSVVMAACSFILYHTWYKTLRNETV